MNKIRTPLALLVLTLTPLLVSSLNGGEAPTWMIWLAIIGFVIAFISFFLPKRDDLS